LFMCKSYAVIVMQQYPVFISLFPSCCDFDIVEAGIQPLGLLLINLNKKKL